jgi:AraC-like DNA-binding protein
MEFQAGANVLPIVPDPDTARSPVVGFAWDQPRHIAWHRHQRGQIISVIKGTIRVNTHAGTWVVPRNRAVWIPPDMEHCATYSRVCRLRTIFPDATVSTNFPRSRCIELYLDSLSRELLNVAVQFDWDLHPSHSDMRLAELLIERMPHLDQPALRVPEGRDPRVMRVMQLLRDAPDDDRTLAQLSREAGATERTMARLFIRDTAMSFSEWRRQYRLMLALEQIAEGVPITIVAHNLGYDSAGNFSTMFRKFFRRAPSEFFELPKTR